MQDKDIRVQNVVSIRGIELLTFVEDPAVSRESVEYFNTWMSDRLADHSDSLMLVASMRYEDIDWSIRQLLVCANAEVVPS